MFALLGLSGISSAASALVLPYRPGFQVGTIGILGLSHYLLWRNRRATVWNRVIVWTATALALGQLAFPYVRIPLGI